MSTTEDRLSKVEVESAKSTTWRLGHEQQCAERYSEIRDEQTKTNKSIAALAEKTEIIYKILWSGTKALLAAMTGVAGYLFAKVMGWT